MDQLYKITENFSHITNLNLWQHVFLNNTIGTYLEVVGIFILFIILFGIFQKMLLKYLNNLAQKTKTDIDDIFIDIVNSLTPPFYSFIAFYFAMRFLVVTDLIQNVLNTLFIIWVVYQIILALQILTEFIFRKILRRVGGKSSEGALGIVKNIMKALLWIAGLLIVLDNLGVNITALVAGLGIGGIAIAFAFQNILEDLFSSFAILFDKPFQIGDFVVIGDKMGTVKKIGIKTTRIKSTQGEEIVISNKEITSSQLRNFKKMEERRIVFKIGLTYETSTEKLKRVPTIIEKIIKNTEKVRFDRSHFVSFDDFSLTFETVYFVLSSDYNEYRDVNQKIIFAIRESFEEEKIEMAYPTQVQYNKNA